MLIVAIQVSGALQEWKAAGALVLVLVVKVQCNLELALYCAARARVYSKILSLVCLISHTLTEASPCALLAQPGPHNSLPCTMQDIAAA